MTELVNLQIRFITESNALEMHLNMIGVPDTMNQEMFLSLSRMMEEAH